MNKWKWGVIAALIIAAWVVGCNYGIKSVGKSTIVDTAITHIELDTIYSPVPTTILHDTIIYRVRHDTLEMPPPDVVYLPSNTPNWLADVANDYNTVRNYDTMIIRAGDTIQIADMVTKNTIQKRWIRAVWNDTVITKTTILKPPLRTIGYFTGSGMFNQQQNIGAGIGFAIKNKHETVYQLEWVPFGHYRGYSGRIFIPIKLHK